jgi:hypothetical protein
MLVLEKEEKKTCMLLEHAARCPIEDSKSSPALVDSLDASHLSILNHQTRHVSVAKSILYLLDEWQHVTDQNQLNLNLKKKKKIS